MVALDGINLVAFVKSEKIFYTRNKDTLLTSKIELIKYILLIFYLI